MQHHNMANLGEIRYKIVIFSFKYAALHFHSFVLERCLSEVSLRKRSTLCATKTAFVCVMLMFVFFLDVVIAIYTKFQKDLRPNVLEKTMLKQDINHPGVTQ